MAISKEFQNRFIELSDEMNLKNKTEIAKRIGLTYATFSKIYSYGIYPTTPILVRIADYFNISVDYLVGTTDDEYFEKSKNPKMFMERLEELKSANNIKSTYALADCIGIHRSNISQWNKCNYIPAIDDLTSIATYFKVSIDYLLGRTDYKK